MTGPEVTQPDPDGGVEMTDGEWAAFRGVEVTAAMKAEDVDAVVRVLAETSRCAWSLGDPKHPYGKDCLDDHPDKHPGVGYCWLLPTRQAEALAEAGLLRDGGSR